MQKKNTPAATKTTAPVKEESASPFKEISKLGEIVPASGPTIHVREVEIAGRSESDKPRRVLDVRQYIEGKKFTGWGKGISIPADQVEELRDFCDEYMALAAKRKELKAAKKAKK